MTKRERRELFRRIQEIQNDLLVLMLTLSDRDFIENEHANHLRSILRGMYATYHEDSQNWLATLQMEQMLNASLVA